ncbi:carbohydrate kinase family protein [Candidatus Peregrinibacteria bacterium]|nr:carbohydrate kinase family protein [Candidatus Peregrinibacteria bacterium]
MLNVAFNIETLNVDLGGTAGNIAYSLALLGEKPLIYATAGDDFGTYRKKLDELKLTTDFIKVLPDAKTAQAFITTDLADNQITAFHGGAMYRAHEHPLAVSEKSLVIISPNGPEAMVAHANYCQKNQLPFIFDPGQAFNALKKEDLIHSVENSRALTLNDYEWQLWKEKTGLTESQTLDLTEATIITLGEKGSLITTRKGGIAVPALKNLNVIDPTGSGDAFRAGLLYGLSRGMDWKVCAQIGTTLASYCVEIQGPQNHRFTLAKFKELYRKAWGEKFSE